MRLRACMSIQTSVSLNQSVSFFSTISVEIDERIEVLWRFEFFEKCL